MSISVNRVGSGIKSIVLKGKEIFSDDPNNFVVSAQDLLGEKTLEMPREAKFHLPSRKYFLAKYSDSPCRVSVVLGSDLRYSLENNNQQSIDAMISQIQSLLGSSASVVMKTEAATSLNEKVIMRGFLCVIEKDSFDDVIADADKVVELLRMRIDRGLDSIANSNS